MSNNPNPIFTRIIGRGLGLLLLALWCFITGMIQIGVPLQALSPILAWMLAAAGLFILLGY